MRFSIIIPAFNAERYFCECLASIDAQDFCDYELLLIDDGSSDGTAAIMDRYAAEHPNVNVRHGANEGLLLARRNGLKIAKGDYVIFLDADDCLKSNALEVINSAIVQSNADIVAFHCSREADCSSAGDASALPEGLYDGKRYGLVKEHVCRGRFNNLWGKAFRSECIDITADYTAYKGLMHGEDLFQLLPIVEAATSLYQLSDVLYFYRPNEQSSTARYRQSQLTDVVTVNRRLNEYAASWGPACAESAYIGETNLYIYLLKMSELSDSRVSEKREAFNEIRAAMLREGVFQKRAGSGLRPDNRLILEGLEKGNRLMARTISMLSERIKSTVIRSGNRSLLEGIVGRLGFK